VGAVVLAAIVAAAVALMALAVTVAVVLMAAAIVGAVVAVLVWPGRAGLWLGLRGRSWRRGWLGLVPLGSSLRCGTRMPCRVLI
jgi:hypothetical protein